MYDVYIYIYVYIVYDITLYIYIYMIWYNIISITYIYWLIIYIYINDIMVYIYMQLFMIIDVHSELVSSFWKLNAWHENFSSTKVSGNMEGAGASSLSWVMVINPSVATLRSSAFPSFNSGHFRVPFMGIYPSITHRWSFFPPIARRPEMNHHNGAQSWKLSKASSSKIQQIPVLGTEIKPSVQVQVPFFWKGKDLKDLIWRLRLFHIETISKSDPEGSIPSWINSWTFRLGWKLRASCWEICKFHWGCWAWKYRCTMPLRVWQHAKHSSKMFKGDRVKAWCDSRQEPVKQSPKTVQLQGTASFSHLESCEIACDPSDPIQCSIRSPVVNGDLTKRLDTKRASEMTPVPAARITRRYKAEVEKVGVSEICPCLSLVRGQHRTFKLQAWSFAGYVYVIIFACFPHFAALDCFASSDTMMMWTRNRRQSNVYCMLCVRSQCQCLEMFSRKENDFRDMFGSRLRADHVRKSDLCAMLRQQVQRCWSETTLWVLASWLWLNDGYIRNCLQL